MVPGASSGPSPQPAPSCQFCDAWGEENELAADRGAARGVLPALGTPALLWGAPKQPPKQPAAPAERCQPPPQPPRLRTGSHPAQHLLPSRTQPPPETSPCSARHPRVQTAQSSSGGKGAEPGSCRPAAGRTARNQQSRFLWRFLRRRSREAEQEQGGGGTAGSLCAALRTPPPVLP